MFVAEYAVFFDLRWLQEGNKRVLVCPKLIRFLSLVKLICTTILIFMVMKLILQSEYIICTLLLAKYRMAFFQPIL